MSSNEEKEKERAAMLEKIRMDMEQTRERINMMKQRKSMTEISTGEKQLSNLQLLEKLRQEKKDKEAQNKPTLPLLQTSSSLTEVKSPRELLTKAASETVSNFPSLNIRSPRNDKDTSIPNPQNSELLSQIQQNQNLDLISSQDINNKNNNNEISNHHTPSSSSIEQITTPIVENTPPSTETFSSNLTTTTIQQPTPAADINNKDDEQSESNNHNSNNNSSNNNNDQQLQSKQSEGIEVEMKGGRSDRSPSIDIGGEKKKIIIRKVDGKEVREVVQMYGEDGDKMITADGKIIRIRKVGETADPKESAKKTLLGNARGSRSPSIADGSSSSTATPKKFATPPPGKLPDDHQPTSSSPSTSTSSSNTNTPKSKGGVSSTGKGIRSLDDLQKAIKKADRVKKQAQTQGKIEQLRRERDQTKLKMTREEKKAVRASKRLTVEMQHSETRVKVDHQISSFMKMMQTLEMEWQKGEEIRLKREQELDQQRQMLETAAEQMSFLAKTMGEVTTKIDHMKLLLDRLVDQSPKAVKKEEKWSEELKNFQELFWQMRHDLYVNTAKYNKMEKKVIQTASDIANNNNAPPPPTLPSSGGLPPPPPPTTIQHGSSNPISNLLAQIRSGTSLKKLDPEEVKKEQATRKGNWRQSVALLQGLQDTLRDALDQRHLALLDSDSDSDSDEDDWDDEE